MASKEEVAAAIRTAFANTPYPGDAFLLNSTEGCEPEDEVGPFRGREGSPTGSIPPFWTATTPRSASSRKARSESSRRCTSSPTWTIPLLAPVDPVFHLTGGFSEATMTVEVCGRTFTRRTGRTQFVNPRRFGAMTFCDYAQFRLSVFTREEAVAIVAYLEFKRDEDSSRPDCAAIDEALDGYWRARSLSAPAAAALGAYLAADADYMTAVLARHP